MYILFSRALFPSPVSYLIEHRVITFDGVVTGGSMLPGEVSWTSPLSNAINNGLKIMAIVSIGFDDFAEVGL